MAKTGRPKAKVSITFSEDELKTMITSLDISLHFSIEEFAGYSIQGLENFGKEVLLMARLRGVRDSKYGDVK